MEIGIYIYVPANRLLAPIVHASILMINSHKELVQTDPFVEQCL
jgi:hypothetical protein